MSHIVEIASFDVESQRSLLATTGGHETSSTSNARLKQALMRIILLIRSTELFKLAANYAPDNISSSSSSASPTHYASISSADDQIQITDQDSGIAASPEISADPSDENILSARPESDAYERNIELQHIQRKNIDEIVKKRNLQDLHNFGGVRGVAEALNTDLEKGIIRPRQISPCKPTQPFQILVIFFKSFREACNNYTILLLSCAALLSLGFGIGEEGLRMGWLNGAILIFTIVVLVTCATAQRFWEEWSSHKKLEDSWQLKGRKIQLLVIRAGQSRSVRELDLEVGDIVILRKGDQVPGDGLFIKGEALELDIGSTDEQNPFLFYGSRVINGKASMLVTSTRMDTTWGEMMNKVLESPDGMCKFESYLHKLNTCIHITGLFISILIIIVLFLRYKAGKLDDERRYRPDLKGEPIRLTEIIDAIKGIITESRGTARILTMLLSVSLLGITDGMLFVVTLATINWRCKTLQHKASVRDYLACVRMASVTTVCSDKFGGLTEYAMEVDKLFIGEEFVSESSVIASNVLEGLCDGIGTLFLLRPRGCESKVIPLISWAEAKLGMKGESVREQCRVINFRGNNPFRECCQVLLEKSGNEGLKKYVHYKGSPCHILPLCSHYYDITGESQELGYQKRMILEQIIKLMLEEESEVIAYAREFVHDCDVASVETDGLIFMGMIGLKDAKWNDTSTAVSTLRDGGITTILASGDDVAMLEIIGQNCGLLTPDSGDLVLSGEEFRAWTNEERIRNVEKIRIIGNCLPSDKILLIKSLREKGKVVALLGQRTTDAPALKQADVGITFGTWSSEVAIESSDITIWNGNFSFLVNLVKNGRCFEENIQKFIQLELIVTISSSLINFTATVFLGDAPITAVQLFWLNLVVSFVGGLALLTGPSNKTLMTMEPVKSSANLITKAMWRNIAIQASYQTTIFVTLQHKGHSILGIDHVKSVIYNGFFLCQIFNSFIARELEKRNIFRGLFHKNGWFWVALVLFLMCQAMFAVAEKVVGCCPELNWELWGVCLLIASVSWLLDWMGKTASILAVWWVEGQGGLWKLNTITRLVYGND